MRIFSTYNIINNMYKTDLSKKKNMYKTKKKKLKKNVHAMHELT